MKIMQFFDDLGVQAKVMGLVAVLLAVMLLAAFNISKIGGDLHEIADAELPLVERLTKVVEHQLEQAILFERAIRFGGMMVEEGGDVKALFNTGLLFGLI